MGLTDAYVAAVKAAILNHAPQAQIVDISHGVRTFDLHHAAFLIREVWKEFPLGTVHVIGVKPEFTMQQAHIVVHHMGHYFIAADNGVIPLILDEAPEEIFEIHIAQGDQWKFPMKGVFALAAAHLSKGGTPEVLGKRAESLQYAFVPGADYTHNEIRGRVVHIDHYGNAITNIHRQEFIQACNGREYSVNFKSSAFDLTKIHEYYTEVVFGERLAMWTTNGDLMIAINSGTTQHGGGAAQLFGLQLRDSIIITFDDNEDSENDNSY
jgi:S-adenosylmethionine hydrolase